MPVDSLSFSTAYKLFGFGVQDPVELLSKCLEYAILHTLQFYHFPTQGKTTRLAGLGLPATRTEAQGPDFQKILGKT